MKKQISIKSDDPTLHALKFRRYRSTVERRVEKFAPTAGEKQSMELRTVWGEALIVNAGDYIVGEIDHPQDRWPVRADIFEETYVITRPGYCRKLSEIELVPLTEISDGDDDVEIVVHSLEGPTKVRAGDFFLARGAKGEIWAYPKDKAERVLALVNE